MQLRITTSIAAPDWSYRKSQIVSVGANFTPDTIPADIAALWLESGLAERLGEVETTTAVRKGKK